MGKGQKKYYAVAHGRKVGVFNSWGDCERQVSRVSNAKFKSFSTRAEADAFVKSSAPQHSTPASSSGAARASASPSTRASRPSGAARASASPSTRTSRPRRSTRAAATTGSTRARVSHASPSQGSSSETVTTIWTDGAASRNGRKGATAGVYFGDNDPRNVSEPLQGSEPTNQRAELMAVIRAVELCPEQPVRIMSDAQYVVKGWNDWMSTWERNGWVTSKKEPVANQDLWKRLKAAAPRRDLVSLCHVRGHAGISGNEAADRLAVAGVAKGSTSHKRARRETRAPSSDRVTRSQKKLQGSRSVAQQPTVVGVPPIFLDADDEQ